MDKFRKATRQKLKASIMIEGLQGSGKSGLALILAKALTEDWDKIYAIDTENRSLDLFQGINKPRKPILTQMHFFLLQTDLVLVSHLNLNTL